MSSYKEEIDRTERLKTSLDSKVIAIADEIKKQDDISITKLSEVPDAIARLKNSRKRWASGTNANNRREYTFKKEGYTTTTILICKLPPLPFKPSLILMWAERPSDGYIRPALRLSTEAQSLHWYYGMNSPSSGFDCLGNLKKIFLFERDSDLLSDDELIIFTSNGTGAEQWYNMIKYEHKWIAIE